MNTTKADFKEFKDSFEYYAYEVFGLREYRCDFSHEDIGDSYAELHYNVSGGVASVILNSKLPEECSQQWEGPAVSGKHEAIHLLIARLVDLTRERYTTPKEINKEEERLVRILENVIE